MATAKSRVRHFPLHSMKIKRAARALRAKTETQAIARALDFVIAEHEKTAWFSRPMSASLAAEPTSKRCTAHCSGKGHRIKCQIRRTV